MGAVLEGGVRGTEFTRSQFNTVIYSEQKQNKPVVANTYLYLPTILTGKKEDARSFQ